MRHRPAGGSWNGWFCLAGALVAASLAGCGGGAAKSAESPPETVGAVRRGGRVFVVTTANIPFPEVITAPGHQSRVLPWMGEVVDSAERVALEVPLPETRSDGNTPGLEAASQWFAALDRARQRTTARVAQRPASEPAPGKQSSLTVAEFAQARPPFREKYTEQLLQAPTTQIMPGDGRGSLTLNFPLEPVGRQVLDLGGGFSSESPQGLEAQPRTIAQREALEKTERAMLEQVMLHEVAPGFTLLDWVGLDANNRRHLDVAVKAQRIVSSGEAIVDGKSFWNAEREVEITDLERRALKDFKVEQDRQEQARRTRERRDEADRERSKSQ